MTNDELTEYLRLAAGGLALADKATPRLQRLRTVQDVIEFYSVDEDNYDQHDILIAEFNRDADADVYFDARTRVPALCAAVAVLTAEMRELRQQCDGLRFSLKDRDKTEAVDREFMLKLQEIKDRLIDRLTTENADLHAKLLREAAEVRRLDGELTDRLEFDETARLAIGQAEVANLKLRIQAESLQAENADLHAKLLAAAAERTEAAAKLISSGEFCRLIDHQQGVCDCAEMAAAIRALEVPRLSPTRGEDTLADAAPKWLPIASAPKDGTEILTYRGVGLIAVAAWMSVGKYANWIVTDGMEIINLTHWMPLPAGPIVPPPEDAE